MDRALGDPESSSTKRGGRLHGSQHGRRVPGRHDVVGFGEVGAFECVWLVEYRQCVPASVGHEAFHRHFGASYVGLDEDRVVVAKTVSCLNLSNPVHGALRLGGRINPDHPHGSGETQRFDDNRPFEPGHDLVYVVVCFYESESRLGTTLSRRRRDSALSRAAIADSTEL